MPEKINTAPTETKNIIKPGLNLPEGLIQPEYTNRSLLNLPATISSILGSYRMPYAPLDINPPISLTGIQQVILCLLDGLSYNRFMTWIEKHALHERLAEEGFIEQITSVAPSTTCTALTTLWSGRSPSEHAVLGYELFLKEYGIVSNMITHSPIKMAGQHGVLYEAGFEPETAIPYQTVGTLLSEDSISTYAFLNKHIRRSGLSRMHYADVNANGFSSLTDLWISVRNLVEKRPTKRRFIWCYYEGIDNSSHHRHPDGEYAKAEFDAFIGTLEELFLKPLQSQGGHTLVLLTADHGQIVTPKKPDFDLANHPELLKMLHLYPTGENRLAYLHVQPGKIGDIQNYFSRTWGDSFVLLDSQTALEQGLFGPGRPAVQTASRIGDLLVISTGDSYLWWGDRPNPLEGRHGGLSTDEMIVPLAGLVL